MRSMDHISKVSAQSIFKLEGLPLTLRVVRLDDPNSLMLRVVGLDCPDELQRLEAALHKRLLILRSATLLKVGFHVDQTFELVLKRRWKSPLKDYLTKHLPNRVEITEVTAESVHEEFPASAAITRTGGFKGTHLLRLFVQCPQCRGERGIIAKTMAELNFGFHCAKLQTLDGRKQTICDTYWMTALSPESQSRTSSINAQKAVEEFELALFDHIQSLSVEKTSRSRRSLSPLKDYWQRSPPQEDSEPFQYPRNEDSGVSRASRTTSNNSMGHFMCLLQEASGDGLPIPLQWTRQLEYAIHKASVGFMVPGFEKYVGMGLVQRSLKEMLSGKKEAESTRSLVLEMHTFFISQKHATGHLAQFSHRLCDALVSTPDYSHFVTWLSIAERTWTIDKVFLNDVLPAGHGHGAEAMSEHLLASPDLFFHADDSAKFQFRSFLESLPDLKKIVVSDIINWNTYLLMAVAGSTEEETKDFLGDILDFALQIELQHADLTRNQLSELSLLEVFGHTVLGKLCSSVLKNWNSRMDSNAESNRIQMESAEVVFGEGDEEIFGQRRPRMAVIVHLGESKPSPQV